MKAKSIVSAVLLLFVAASVGYFVIDELTGGGEVPADSRHAPAAEGNHVIVYYFHGHKRCDTCRTIEAYAAEAIEAGFPEEVQSGEVVWNVVNVELPGNYHFITDYQLANKTVVLVEVRDGKETRYQQLNRVWELVRNKESFLEYVQESTRQFMGM